MLTRDKLIRFTFETVEQTGGKWEQLYYCKAAILELDNAIILKSYDTIVAIYNRSNGSVYAFDNYSATTCSHVYKFARYCEAVRIVKLYKDSTKIIEQSLSKYANTYALNNKQWRDVISRDFAGYITSKWI